MHSKVSPKIYCLPNLCNEDKHVRACDNINFKLCFSSHIDTQEKNPGNDTWNIYCRIQGISSQASCHHHHHITINDTICYHINQIKSYKILRLFNPVQAFGGMIEIWLSAKILQQRQDAIVNTRNTVKRKWDSLAQWHCRCMIPTRDSNTTPINIFLTNL